MWHIPPQQRIITMNHTNTANTTRDRSAMQTTANKPHHHLPPHHHQRPTHPHQQHPHPQSHPHSHSQRPHMQVELEDKNKDEEEDEEDSIHHFQSQLQLHNHIPKIPYLDLHLKHPKHQKHRPNLSHQSINLTSPSQIPIPIQRNMITDNVDHQLGHDQIHIHDRNYNHSNGTINCSNACKRKRTSSHTENQSQSHMESISSSSPSSFKKRLTHTHPSADTNANANAMTARNSTNTVPAKIIERALLSASPLSSSSSSSPSSFSFLPEELILKIVSFIGPRSSSLLHLSCVNTHFHTLLSCLGDAMLHNRTQSTFRILLPKLHPIESNLCHFIRHARCCHDIVTKCHVLKRILEKDFIVPCRFGPIVIRNRHLDHDNDHGGINENYGNYGHGNGYDLGSGHGNRANHALENADASASIINNALRSRNVNAILRASPSAASAASASTTSSSSPGNNPTAKSTSTSTSNSTSTSTNPVTMEDIDQALAIALELICQDSLSYFLSSSSWPPPQPQPQESQASSSSSSSSKHEHESHSRSTSTSARPHVARNVHPRPRRPHITFLDVDRKLLASEDRKCILQHCASSLEHHVLSLAGQCGGKVYKYMKMRHIVMTNGCNYLTIHSNGYGNGGSEYGYGNGYNGNNGVQGHNGHGHGHGHGYHGYDEKRMDYRDVDRLDRARLIMECVICRDLELVQQEEDEAQAEAEAEAETEAELELEADAEGEADTNAYVNGQEEMRAEAEQLQQHDRDINRERSRDNNRAGFSMRLLEGTVVEPLSILN